MIPSYLYWQYIAGPRWLIILIWNMQRVILRAFSVPVLIKTLFSAWHKDHLSYSSANSVYTIIQTMTLNAISRAIGFIVRSTVILIWVLCEIMYLFTASVIFILFILWPVISFSSIVIGLWLILNAP